MALPPLSWGRYIAIVLLYWVLVVGGWIFYTTSTAPPPCPRGQCAHSLSAIR